MSSNTRRGILGTVASAAFTGLAGCAVGFGGTPTAVDVTVANDDAASHTVDAVVTFRGTTLLDEGFVLGPGEEQEAVLPNPDETGEATLSVTLPDGDPLGREIPIGRGSGLDAVRVGIAEDAGLRASVALR